MVKDIAFFAYSVRDVPRARVFIARRWACSLAIRTASIGSSSTWGARPLESETANRWDSSRVFHRRCLRNGRHERHARATESQRRRSRRSARVSGVYNLLCSRSRRQSLRAAPASAPAQESLRTYDLNRVRRYADAASREASIRISATSGRENSGGGNSPSRASGGPWSRSARRDCLDHGGTFSSIPSLTSRQ